MADRTRKSRTDAAARGAWEETDDMSPDCSPACQQDRHGHCGGCVCGCHVFARLGMQPGWNG